MKKNYQEILLADYETKLDCEKWYDKNAYHNILVRRGKEYCGKCGKLLSECNCKGIKREPLKDFVKQKSHAGYPYNSVYYATLNSVENQLLIRYYVVNCEEKIGQEATYWYKEVMRILIDENGKYKVARLGVYTIFSSWNYRYDSELKVLKQFNANKYDILTKNIKCNSKPTWLKYFKYEWLLKLNAEIREIKKKEHDITGYYTITTNADIYNLSLLDFIKEYISKPILIETLCKCNRYDLLVFETKYHYDDEMLRLLKHNRKLPTNDYRLYKDYLSGLHMLNKDTKNIAVICPTDFEVKNKMVEKACAKVRDEVELKNNILQYNEKYTNRVSKLAGVIFGNDKFIFSILPNVKAFWEEADSMCHCVYRMGYYKIKDSYIFSVRDKDTNKRLETAELKLGKNKELVINQCYGYGDKFTPHHNQIVQLLNENLGLIRQYI